MSIFNNQPALLKQLHALWQEKPWTRPQPAGLSPTMGYGDRLGLATPGHLLAHSRAGCVGKVVPLFAQQSGREMERIGRTPAEVMWDACKALADTEYRGVHAADADHMKTEEQVAGCVEAGFTFFTADPSELVWEEASRFEVERVEKEFVNLGSEGRDLIERHEGSHQIEGIPEPVRGDPLSLKRIALVYGRALGRVRDIEGWVASSWKGELPFDFEVSVDETSTPTTPLAHRVIARELKRMGVRFTSLAPRFVGEFQKAVDYVGDLGAFEETFRVHAAIARQEGPYKISVHSGSDKFSLYPAIAQITGGQVHLKTSGTSYLEALRVAARKEAALFRKIARFCGEVFESQRASYHIHATLADLPDAECLGDRDLEERFLSSPDADAPRQILHVCFGAVLSADGGNRFAKELKALLARERTEYAEVLAQHLGKHLVVFG